MVERLYPDTHTLVDIGGEDSKIIFFAQGRIPDMRMNGNCAGGTGAFIDQTATLLGVAVEDLNDLAAQSTTIYPIASRCGVFSKTDIQNLISRSVAKADIAASMLHALSVQVVNDLTHGTEIIGKVFLCGDPLAHIPAYSLPPLFSSREEYAQWLQQKQDTRSYFAQCSLNSSSLRKIIRKILACLRM